MSGKRSNIARSLASSWGAFAAHVVVTLVLTPFVLKTLGDTRYGIWVLINSVTGYYGFLDIGIRSAITHYVTRSLGQGDYARMNQVASSGFYALTIVSLLILVASGVLAYALPTAFSLDPDLHSEASWCVIIVGVSVVVQFLLFTHSSVITAKERFDLERLIFISLRLASALATFVLLQMGYGLVGLCLAVAVSNALDYVLRYIVARRLLPELKISVADASLSLGRQFMSYAFWTLIIKGAGRIVCWTDSIVIGAFMPITAVAWYALAVNLITYFDNAFVPVGYVLFPRATLLDADGDNEAMKRLYLSASRLLSLAVLACSLLAGLWAHDFYLLWVGENYVRWGGEYPSVAILAAVLVAGAGFRASQLVGVQILLGSRNGKMLAGLVCAEAAINLGLSVVLVQQIGVMGVALGTTIPSIVFQGVIRPIVVCRFLKIPLFEYIKLVVLPTILVILAASAPLGALRFAWVSRNWFELVGIIAVGGLTLGVCGWFAGLRAEDKENLLSIVRRRHSNAVEKQPG